MRQEGRGLSTARRRLLYAAHELWASTALLLCAATVTGVLLGETGFDPPGALLGAAMGLGVCVAVAGRRRRPLWLLSLLAVALALGLWRYAAVQTPSGPAGLPFYMGRDVTIVGTIAAAPEPLDRGENLRVSVETLANGSGTRRVAGLVLVHLGTITPLAYGDRVQLAGQLGRPPELPVASAGSYRAYLAAQGIYAVLDYPRLHHLGPGSGNALLALVIGLRLLLQDGIKRILPEPEASLLLGILLGTRTRALGALTAPFIATGMIHVIAIDGLKVAIVAGSAYGVARRLLAPRHALYPALAVLALYTLLTGATPAGLRAALMWSLALVALRVGRRSDALTSLALAAAILALITPRIVWDLGFQLSVAGTAAIVALSPLIARRLAGVPTVAREPVAVTLAAQVGTLPLLVGGFGQVSLVAPLANALLLPLLGPIMALGTPAAILGAVAPGIGHVVALLVYPLLAAMVAAVQILAALPLAALAVGSVPPAFAIGYYALVGLGLLAPARAPAPEVARWSWRVRLGATAGAIVACALTAAFLQAPRRGYTLTVLPLGGGQGLLVTTPDDRAALVDGGAAPSRLDAALGARLPFWRARLDVVVLSDVSPSYTAGLRGLLGRYAVGRALDPGAVYPPADYARWRADLREAAVPEAKLRAGHRYVIDGHAYLDALLPAALDPDAPAAPVALRVVIPHLSVLLLNRAALALDPSAFRARGFARNDALVLPAGGDAADTATLLRLLRPRLVVLPSPDDARDDPSADAALARVGRAIGARVWQTGGDSSLEIDAGSVPYTLRVAP